MISNASTTVHIDLWFALQPLMAQTSNAYNLLCSAVLINQCSHDLFYWGLCKLQDLPVQYVPVQHLHTQSDIRKIVSQGGKSFVHIHQTIYGLITDGPVHLDRPFAFGLKVCVGRGRLEPNRHVECSIGYVPWPPDIECLYRSAGSLLAAKGSVFFTFSPTRA